jgi:hypothetical protein
LGSDLVTLYELSIPEPLGCTPGLRKANFLDHHRQGGGRLETCE